MGAADEPVVVGVLDVSTAFPKRGRFRFVPLEPNSVQGLGFFRVQGGEVVGFVEVVLEVVEFELLLVDDELEVAFANDAG